MGHDQDVTKCEVCGQKTNEIRCGCETCGRLFAPCCNSVVDDLCVECS